MNISPKKWHQCVSNWIAQPLCFRANVGNTLKVSIKSLYTVNVCGRIQYSFQKCLIVFYLFVHLSKRNMKHGREKRKKKKTIYDGILIEHQLERQFPFDLAELMKKLWREKKQNLTFWRLRAKVSSNIN